MTDIYTPEKRSEIMRQVSGKNTKPEILLQKLVSDLHIKFIAHYSELPGEPDLAFVRIKRVMFMHGCFWHGHKNCANAARPTSNGLFWNEKLDATLVRDRRHVRELRKMGWKALIIWECQLRKNPRGVNTKLKRFLSHE